MVFLTYSHPLIPQEHNGFAERRHRHLVETRLTLLHQASLPLKFWSQAFQTAAYLINRMPTPTLDFRSPFQVLFKKDPNYQKLKVFGCLCYPCLRPFNSNKFEPRSKPCIFLGYSGNKSAFLCFDTDTSKLHVSRHVVFVENQFPYQQQCTLPTEDFQNSANCFLEKPSLILLQPPTSSSTTSTSSPASCVTSQNSVSSLAPNSLTGRSQLPESATSVRSDSNYHPMVTRLKNNIVKPNPKYFLIVLQSSSETEPSCYSQAVKDSNWRAAMSEEINALIRNDTWHLVPPSPTQNTVGCKWVYRIKRNPDNSISKYKARLVAKDFHQRQRVDYTETFSPVVMPTTIRIVLSIATHSRWPLLQMDVNNAFFHGSLKENVYMKQPPGFVDSTHPEYVCKLDKAIYGLKQAPRAWHNTLSSFLLQYGFTQSRSDSSLFIYVHNHVTAYFLVYVDDFILTGSSETFLHDFIATLSKRFSLKDPQPLHYFLGIETTITATGMLLSQTKYAVDLLQRTNMLECKPISTHMESSQSISLTDGQPLPDATEYRSIIGALQYLLITRPDLSFAVNKLAQFMHAPTEVHWRAIKRVLRYLKGSISVGLSIKYHSNPSTSLYAYADADWAGDTNDRKSTSAYLVYFNDILVSWNAISKRRLLAHQLKLNIEPLRVQLQNWIGFKIC